MPVALADDYLRELRFGRRRAVSTTKACAENLALFFDWADRSGFAVESVPRELGGFVHWLRSSPVERRGTGFGRVRSGQRINAIFVSVRELYKRAVSMGSLDGRVLDVLYVVGDDRFYPGSLCRSDKPPLLAFEFTACVLPQRRDSLDPLARGYTAGRAG